MKQRRKIQANSDMVVVVKEKCYFSLNQKYVISFKILNLDKKLGVARFGFGIFDLLK